MNEILRQYFLAVAKVKEPVAEFVSQHGKAFGDPIPDHPAKADPWTKKLCFMNAALASQRYGLIYVEGFATLDGLPIPIHHAWCVTEDGGIIDYTWDTPGDSYFGVPFDQAFVVDCALTSKYWGILDNPNPNMRGVYREDPARFLHPLWKSHVA